MSIDIVEHYDGYCLAWFDADAGDEGDLTVGEPCPDTEDPFDAMFNAVTDGLRKLFPPDDVGRAHSPDTMFWNTASRAKQARSIARMIQKQFESNRPWPEWALKAKAEGWKPPRGWKP